MTNDCCQWTLDLYILHLFFFNEGFPYLARPSERAALALVISAAAHEGLMSSTLELTPNQN